MKSFKIMAAFVLAVSFASCIENKASESNLKSLSANISTRVIGVGVSEDIAVMDSYSSYYALKEGVRFSITDGKVKLKLDFENVPVDTLAGSRVTRPWNGFVIYDYPYNGALSIRSANIKKLSVSIRLTRPFSFLSRMLAKSLLENYAGDPEKKSGTVYITSMDYDVSEGQSVEVRSEILIAEDSVRTGGAK